MLVTAVPPTSNPSKSGHGQSESLPMVSGGLIFGFSEIPSHDLKSPQCHDFELLSKPDWEFNEKRCREKRDV